MSFRTTRDRAQAQVNQAEQAASLMRSGTRPEEITQAEAVVQQKEEALSRSEAGPRSEDIDEAQAQMTAAQGAMQIIQASLNDLVLRAPFTGFFLVNLPTLARLAPQTWQGVRSRLLHRLLFCLSPPQIK